MAGVAHIREYILQEETFESGQFDHNQGNDVPTWNKAIRKVDASDVFDRRCEHQKGSSDLYGTDWSISCEFRQVDPLARHLPYLN